MIIKIKIDRIGKLEDYINLPILDKPVMGFGFGSDSKAIGAITEVAEYDDEHYELTATVWDKFVEQNVELYNSGKAAAVSFRFK